MDGYNIKYEIKRFQNRKTSYEISKASKITQIIIGELKKNNICGIYDKVFYRYEKSEVYSGDKLIDVSQNLSERIVIIPEIACSNPHSKYNINIYVDLSAGVMVVCFFKTAQGFLHYNDNNSENFKNSQLSQLVETIQDLISKEYSSISFYCGKDKKYNEDRFEPNYTKTEIIKNMKPSINIMLQNLNNFEELKKKAYIQKNVWNEKTTYIYKIY